MTQNAPGKSHRDGISLLELTEMFPDEQSAHAWFVEQRWSETGRVCPRCESDETTERKTGLAYWCPRCRRQFSVRTGTVMERSHIPLRKWAFAIYLSVTSLKGVSSMKLHRDLKITQKSAWFMAHRIREAWASGDDPFVGPVEVDETFVGGKEKNKREWQRERKHARGGMSEKIAVVGAKDRTTKRVRAEVIGQARGPVLRHFVRQHTAPGARLYSDGHGAYVALDGEFDHRAVQHSAGTYAIGDVSTNGIESFWSMLKRGYVGTYHQMSARHLHRYVAEFTGRHNQRDLDTIAQMRALARALVGKRLQYRELTT